MDPAVMSSGSDMGSSSKSTLEMKPLATFLSDQFTFLLYTYKAATVDTVALLVD
jgi:hypothetical protein